MRVREREGDGGDQPGRLRGNDEKFHRKKVQIGEGRGGETAGGGVGVERENRG